MKETLALIQTELQLDLDKLAKKYKLASFKVGSGTYGSNRFTLKLEGLGAGGKTPEAERYEMNAARMKLPPAGSTIVVGKHTWEPFGLNTTGTKVLAKRLPDGKEYLLHTPVVQAAWKDGNP